MKCFDILSPKTEILGKRFLEASAGTGKTFAIEHLVVRLIREGHLNLEEILVVTFTRAATRELKMRIRAQLEKNGLGKALLSFDQAQIYTIHGFCQKMLQEFAFEAKVGFNLKEWKPQDEQAALQEFLQSKLEARRYSTAQVSSVMKKFRHDMEKLEGAILKEKKQTRKERFFGEWHDEFNQKLSEVPIFSVRDEFARVRDYYKGMSEEFSSQVILIDNLLQKRGATEKEFDELLTQKPHFLEKLDLSNRKLRAPSFSLHPGLQDLCQKIGPILEAASCQNKTLKRLASDWQQEREKISREEERASPDEILAQMEKSLNVPQFVSQVRAKYQAVIVDEFQDTDPIQWKIFETLFLHHDLKAFYLVGDPKQSIYAFRNADIYTYMKASKGLEIGYLDTNYRSTSGLIETLNRLFCKTSWIDLPALSQTIPVLPVKAAKEGEGSVHFFIAEGHLGRGKRWPSVELEERYFFPFIAAHIIEPNQTVILVKDRYQGQRVQQFLQKWNIPSSISKGGSLADSLALDALEEIIEAVLDPKYIKKALLGPLIGLTIDDLDDEAIFSARDVFASLKEILFEKGFAAFYASLLKSKWRVLEKLVAQKDLNLYYDLNAVVEKVIHERDPDRLLDEFENLRNLETEDRVLGENGGVQIMTIHASKGLEFDTVFALGLASRTPEQDEPEEVLKELDAEKMRQLYVALTRAKTRAYVPVARDLDQKPIPTGTASAIEIFLERTTPDLSEFPHTILNQTSFELKKFQKDETIDLCPPLPLGMAPKRQFLQSFSGLSHKTHERISPPPDALPVGAETGVIVHRILEKALISSVNIAEEVAGTLLKGWEAQLQEMLDKTLKLPLLDFPRDRMLQELEFVYPTEDGLIKGFIDLCFEKDGKYYLVDWKTNWLADYSQPSLEKAMQEGDYFLQATIYAQALKRYLKLYDPRPFEECFAGAYYIFVRGPAVYRCECFFA